MTAPSVTPSQVRCTLLLRDEIALLDLRHEAAHATGHPLFAANMAVDRIALGHWGTLTFVSSTEGCRRGGWRVMNYSRM